MPYCSICRVSTTRSNIKVVRVPKDPIKRKLWEDSLDFEFNGECRICVKHFQPCDFKPITTRNTATKRTELMPNAVPQKLICADEILPESTHKSSAAQTESDIIESGIILENLRMKKELEALRKQNSFLLKESLQTRKSLSAIFTETQLNRLQSGKQRHWTPEDISYGMCLHSAGPRAYDHLCAKGFPLPSRATLQRWASKVLIKPGMIDFAINVMKFDIELSEDEKLCVLLFAKMNITSSSSASPFKKDYTTISESENYVNVVMARGLNKTWKQPVFFDIGCQMDSSKINQIIMKLHEIGYPVVAIVSNLGPEQEELWNDFGITQDKTWFSNPAAADLKIFVFSNASELINQMKNQLLDTGLMVKGQHILPETVMMLMGYKDTSKLVDLFKIPEEPLPAESTATQNVKLAIQLFSRATANNIRRYSSEEDDVPNPNDIADFFQLTNEWHQVFNTKCFLNLLPPTRPYGTHLAEQESLLKRMTKAMSEPMLPNLVDKAPFQKCIIINNVSLHNLYEYMKKKYNMEYIFTHRLTHDVLEEFFVEVRGKDELVNPSAAQFKYKLRKYLVCLNELRDESQSEITREQLQPANKLIASHSYKLNVKFEREAVK